MSSGKRNVILITAIVATEKELDNRPDYQTLYIHLVPEPRIELGCP
jgi:hypothetical protein